MECIKERYMPVLLSSISLFGKALFYTQFGMASFGDQSDIDLAIISEFLFDKIWRQVFDYWEENENTDNVVYWSRENSFKDYLFRGWIRPDKLPPAQAFDFSRSWWEFFRELTRQGEYGPYKIRAGLYKSWYYLEKYQSMWIKECKQELGVLE